MSLLIILANLQYCRTVDLDTPVVTFKYSMTCCFVVYVIHFCCLSKQCLVNFIILGKGTEDRVLVAMISMLEQEYSRLTVLTLVFVVV